MEGQGLPPIGGLHVSKELVTDAIKDRETLLTLVRNEGWQALKKIVDAQIEVRRSQLEEPGDVTLDNVPVEFVKGEIKGMRTLMALPITLIENWEAVIEKYREQNSGEEEGRDEG